MAMEKMFVLLTTIYLLLPCNAGFNITELNQPVFIGENAVMPCLAKNEAIKQDCRYQVLSWKNCTSPSQSSCDGKNASWGWTGGLNQHGKTETVQNRISIFPNGFLIIRTVHQGDIRKYKCIVSRLNYKSPFVSFVTLTVIESDPTCTNTSTPMVLVTRPTTQAKISETAKPTCRDKSSDSAHYIVAIVILVILLVAALGYVMYLHVKGRVPECCRCVAHSNTPVQL